MDILTSEEFYTMNNIVSLAHHLDKILTDQVYQILPNINFDKLLNKIMSYVLKNTNCSTLETLLSTCGSIVCLKEFSSYSTNEAKSLIAVLSLPWMDISNGLFKTLPLYKYLNVIMDKHSSLLGKSYL